MFSYDQVLDCFDSVPFCSDPSDPLCDRDRQVDVLRSTIERFSSLRGSYDATADWREVQIPFWSSSNETDGAAYRMAISAVERQAVIEPACGTPDDYRFCFAYDLCAYRAMQAAVQSGETSAETAGRVVVDAARDCRLGQQCPGPSPCVGRSGPPSAWRSLAAHRADVAGSLHGYVVRVPCSEWRSDGAGP